jgi:hypothetical protein
MHGRKLDREIEMLKKQDKETQERLFALEVTGKVPARYTGKILTNARGRCAICNKVADHVHSEEGSEA